MLPVVAVPGVGQTFDAAGNMIDERTRNMVAGLGEKLARTIEKLV